MRKLMKVDQFVRITVIVMVVSAAFPAVVKAQSQDYPPSFLDENFMFRNWTVKDGLPVNSITSITQSENGYIWMGTSDGLVRFNGTKFKLFRTDTYPDLKYNRIKGVISYQDGVLILNEYGQLLQFRNGGFSEIHVPPELMLSEKLLLRKTRNKEIFVISDNQHYRLVVPGRLTEDDRLADSLLTGRKEGDYSWDDFSASMYWNEKLILRLDNQINDGVVDHEGNLWLASYANGLYQIKRNYFKTFSIEEGLVSRSVYPVTESKNGTLWIGTYGGGISSIRNGEVNSGFQLEGTGNYDVYIRSLIERSNGMLLATDLGGIIYRYSEGEGFDILYRTGLGQINHLFEDTGGTLWLGTSSGLYFEEEGEWVHVDESAISGANIRVINEAGDGSLWVGTSGQGVFHIARLRVTQFAKEDGLTGNLIRSIRISQTGAGSYDVLIGTEDQGITVIPVRSGGVENDQIMSLTKDQGLYAHSIHVILEDNTGRLWMSSNRGIFWIYKTDLEQYLKGNLKKIISTAYTEEDGLRNREASGGMQPAGLKDRSGRLWFSTQDGVVMVDPAQVRRNTVSPEVHIERIASKNNEFEPYSDLIQPEMDDRTLELEFSALSFAAPRKNRFRYRLFDFDDDWIEAGSKASVRYTNIPPGEYTFKVIASNNHGLWNQEGDMINVVIPAHFYEQAWFYVLIAALALGLFLSGYYLMKNRLDKALAEKEKEISGLKDMLMVARSKIEDQHQLKQSLLFNLKSELKEPVLNLRENIEPNGKDMARVVDLETRKMLSQIDQLMLLSEIEIDGIKLNATAEDLNEVVRTSIALHKSDADEDDPVIEFSSNSEHLPVYVDLKLALLIFRNLIRNATEHTGVNRVRIQIVEESSICSVKITDNGQPLSHQELHSVFTLFKNVRQTKAQRSELGIDLPLVAKLVELHKATIIVHSMPVTGNTYVVTFKKGVSHLDKYPALQSVE